MRRIKRPFAVIAFSMLTAYTVLMTYNEKLLLCMILITASVCTVTAVLQKAVSRVYLLICVSLIVSGLLFNASIALPEYVCAVSGYNTKVSGTLLTYPENTGGESSFFIISDAEINGTEIYGKIRVYSPYTDALSPGDKITFTASKLVPSESNGIFRYHFLSEKTYLTAFTFEEVEIIQKHSDSNLYTKIMLLRKIITDKFSEDLPKDHAALANALVTGDKSLISAEVQYGFRICGVSHIFAVSGMHLSLWTGIFFIIFRKRAKISFIPNLAAIIFVLFYCVFTGFSPSVLRSGIMLITVFAAKIIRRHSDSINTWGIAGTVLLSANPFLAGNISFLLSYTATFAMLFFDGYILPENKVNAQNFRFLRKRIISIRSSFLISLSIILVTLPISALFLGYVSLLSPFSSLILTPIAEAIMITSGIGAIIPGGNFISQLVFNLTGFFCDIMLRILNTLKEFDFMMLAVEFRVILPYFIVTAFTVALIIKYTQNKKMAIKCILLSMILLTASTIIDFHIHSGETKIFIPSSGNATMITVTKDNAKAFVYGSGGSFSACSDTVDYLNRNRIFVIDKLFIPRHKMSESLNTDYLSERVFPINTTNLYKMGKRYIYKETLWTGTEIYSETSDTFSASVLYIDDIKIVICSLPSSDFSEENSIFSEGDILICRNKIPNTLSAEKFGTVIVMTDIELIKPTSNTVSTKNGNTEIIIKGDSYAVNR